MKLHASLSAASLLLALALAPQAAAHVISPEAALQRLAAEAAAPAQMRAAARTAEASQATPAFTVSTTSGQPAAYAFTSSGSTLILSADSEAMPLLAYTDSPSDLINPTLRAWLQFYAWEIETLRQNPLPAGAVVAAARPERVAVAPILTTRWNQSAPYNDLCPRTSADQPTMTGCVATAMAQVIHALRQPARCTGGTYSYNCESLGRTVSFDFDQYAPDWDNMLDDYATTTATDAQKHAVAELMLAVGVCADMGYGAQASGAYGQAVARGIVRNFGFSPACHMLARDCYTLTDWENMVYGQLTQGRPVYYDGVNPDNSGAHAFVVDGYSTDGFFHLNWGWGGMSDGYFRLSALDPSDQGIGGSSAGYNFAQNIIVDMVPASDTPADAPLYFTSYSALTPSSRYVNIGSPITFSGGSYNSASVAAPSVTFAIKYTSDATGEVIYADGPGPYTNLAAGTGLSSYSTQVPTLAAGTYTVTQAVKDAAGRYYDVTAPVGGYGIVYATATEGSARVSFSKAETATVTAHITEAPAEAYTANSFPLKATLTNTATDGSYFYSGVSVMLATLSGTRLTAVAGLTRIAVDLEAGQSEDVDWICAIPSSVTPGDYKLVLVDDNGTRLSDLHDITVKAAPTTRITASSFRCTQRARNQLTFTASIRCSSGYFSGRLFLYIFDNTTYTSVASTSSEPMFLSSGDRQTATFTTNFTNGVPGTTYLAAIYQLVDGTMTQLSGTTTFTLAEDLPTALDDIEASGSDAATVVRRFDLTGRPVTHPAPGTVVIEIDSNGHAAKRIAR